ncbi:MAG: CHAT domain-containing protein, partial [Umezawaea sp.]
RLGVRPTLALLTRAQEFITAMQHADQLFVKGEIGQAMLVMDELDQRPEMAEMPALRAQADFNRARVANTLGRLDVALPSAERSVAFFRDVHRRQRTVSNASSLGESLQLVAQIHLRQGNVPKAIELFEEVRDVSGRGAFRQTVVRTEIELARLNLHIDDHVRAAEHAREGYELAAKWKMNDHAVEALDFEALAVAFSGDFDRCRELLRTAQAVLRPDAPAALRAHHLMVRASVAAEEGDLREQAAAGYEFLWVAGEVKAGRGWRQNQADVLREFAEIEKLTLEAAVVLATPEDPDATAAYATALGLLRESDIAGLLRSGLLDADSGAQDGLPGVVSEILGQLAQVEDPDSPATGSPAPLYEKLEAAASARFRQMVQGPSRRRSTRVVPNQHFVQTRMIEDDGKTVLFGCWETPGRDPVPYRAELPPDLARSLVDVTGLGDRKRPPAKADASPEVRASTKGWQHSRQFQALSRDHGEWSALTSLLFPAELLDIISAVEPNADDDEIPLLLLSPDSLLWGLPWSALTIDDSGTALCDRAATALLPTHSLLREDPVPHLPGAGVLSYLRGVDEAGLEVEREALRACWPDQVDEAGDSDDLVRSLSAPPTRSVLTMSVHGDSRPGLAHSLLLDPVRRTRLSAARMMGLRFPRTVVVGACFSGNLDKRLGTDPVGIPSVMLCRGASTVVGGTFPLADGPASGHATATILKHLYTDLARDVQAPWALRRAQQRWRAEHDTSPVTWAGLTAMSNGDFPTR